MARRALSVGTLALGGVIALASGSITYLVTRRFLGTAHGPFVCPEGDHVGAIGYVWPRTDLFVDDSGFGEALETFGYEVGPWYTTGWTACSEDVVPAVAQFQRDFNRVYDAELRTDGLIDDDTVTALAQVHELQESGMSWPLLVLDRS